MGSVRKGYVLLFTCSCVSVSVKPVYTFCSHHAFDVQPRKRMRVCVCVSMLVRVYVCACVCGKLMAVASFLFCHKFFVKYRTVLNGLVNCRAWGMYVAATALLADESEELV